MRRDTRDRLVLPVLLPVGILATVAAVLWGFSRILLSVTHNAATGTAVAVALSIVVVSAVAATRPQVRFSTVASMAGAVAGVAMLAGGIALIAFAPKEEGGPQGPVATVTLVAKNIKFEQTDLKVPAGKPFAIAFDNQDAGTQHNVQIYATKDFSGTPLFNGDLVTGVAKATYDVSALDAGTYYFHCVVHPTTMNGTIQAQPGGGGGGPGGGGITVTAQGLRFDTSEIDLVADQPSTITFQNNDAGTQHNIAIYQDSSLAKNLFKGELVTGVATATYHVPALPAGTYYFHCDVHPTMSGSVVVAPAAGGGSSSPSLSASGG